MPNIYFDPKMPPKLKLNEDGTVYSVHHSHYTNLYYHKFSIFSRKKDRDLCDLQSNKINGCIVFFKSYQNDPQQSTEVRAYAAAAIEEDAQQLQEVHRKRPGCTIL